MLVFPKPFNEILKFELCTWMAYTDDLYDIPSLLNMCLRVSAKGESYNAEFKPVTAPGGLIIYRINLHKVFNVYWLDEKWVSLITLPLLMKRDYMIGNPFLWYFLI